MIVHVKWSNFLVYKIYKMNNSLWRKTRERSNYKWRNLWRNKNNFWFPEIAHLKIFSFSVCNCITFFQIPSCEQLSLIKTTINLHVICITHNRKIASPNLEETNIFLSPFQRLLNWESYRNRGYYEPLKNTKFSMVYSITKLWQINPGY